MLLSVYLKTPTQSVLVGGLNNSLPLPTAIFVLPGETDPSKSQIILDSSSIPAGSNVTGLITLYDAFGNQRLNQDVASVDSLLGIATDGITKIDCEIALSTSEGTYKLTANIQSAGSYKLQVQSLPPPLSQIGHSKAFSI